MCACFLSKYSRVKYRLDELWSVGNFTGERGDEGRHVGRQVEGGPLRVDRVAIC